MSIGRYCLLLGLLLCVCAGALRAEDAQLTVTTDIDVQDNGALRVKETIALPGGTDGATMLYRDLPAVVRGRFGLRRPLAITLDSATLNDQPQSVKMRRVGAYQRVTLAGSSDAAATLVLRYRVDGAMEHDGLRDRISWTVSGTGLPAPVGRLEVNVTLPEAVPSKDARPMARITAVHPVWSSQNSLTPATRVTLERRNSGLFHVAPNRALAADEQMTVSLLVPPGKITFPTSPLSRIIPLNPTLTWGSLAVGLLAIGYLGISLSVGRRPRPKSVQPVKIPPEELTPALARYLWRKTFDHHVTIAALLDLAVSGFVTLHKNGDIYSVRRRDGQDRHRRDLFSTTQTLPDGTSVSRQMPQEERVIMMQVLRGGPAFSLEAGNGLGVRDTEQALDTVLQQRLAELLDTNRRVLVLGLWVSLALVLAVAVVDLLDGSWQESGLSLLGLLLATGGLYGLSTIGLTVWRQALNEPVDQLRHLFVALLISLLLLAGGAAGVLLLWNSTLLLLGLVAAMGVLHLVFARFLPAYTAKGRRYLAQIEGLRLFLRQGRAGKESRLTLDDFARLLPYAVALEVAGPWAAHFTRQAQDAGAWHPAWITTTDPNPPGLSETVHLCARRLPDAISHAAACAAGGIENPI